MVAEILLRELTREHLQWLQNLTNPPRSATTDAAAAAAGGAAAAGLAGSGAQGSGAAGAAPQPGSEPLFEVLLRTEPALAQLVASTAVSAMCWPDAESAQRAITVCK